MTSAANSSCRPIFRIRTSSTISKNYTEIRERLDNGDNDF
jgi:hypothetical protein